VDYRYLGFGVRVVSSSETSRGIDFCWELTQANKAMIVEKRGRSRRVFLVTFSGLRCWPRGGTGGRPVLEDDKIVADECIGEDKQFSYDGHDRDLGMFAAGDEALVDTLDARIEPRGDKGRHTRSLPDGQRDRLGLSLCPAQVPGCWVMGATDAEAAIGRYIDRFYNSTRRHSSLDFISLATYERQAAV
jgi:hypothetical protein